jgi:Zn-finger nucleic acid-binding protein
MPLAAEVTQRAAGVSGRSQEEVGVIEDSGVRLLKTGSPYLSVDKIADLPHKLLGYNPYQPGMSVFGLPRALTSGGLGDARIWFAVATIGCVFGALRVLARSGMPRGVAVRAVQSVGVLPICALTLATGGDDLPILAACLLALAFAASGRFTGAGIAVGCAAAAKLFAWPVLVVLLVLAIRRRRAAGFAPPAIGIPLVTLAPILLLHGKDFVANVVDFPLGRGMVDSTAASPFPGYLIANHLPAGGVIATVLLVVAAIALGVYVVARPPDTAYRAAGVCAVGLLVAIALMPSSRFGYLLYPAVFGVWWWVLNNTAHPNPVWSAKTRTSQVPLVRMEMTCPKCHAKMRQYERNGVTVDQCSECRGIFLDRGELEHLIDADAKFNAQADEPPTKVQPTTPPPAAPAPGQYPPPASPYEYGGQPYYRHSHGGARYKHSYGGHHQGGYGRKRRKSFFDQLFD